MATPYLVASYMAVENDLSNADLTTATFTPVNGEILVVKAACDNHDSPVIGLASGGGLTYTSRVSLTLSNRAPVRLFTAPVTGSPGSMAVTVDFSGGVGRHSVIVERWANAQLAGSPAVGSGFSTDAEATITTAANGSVVTWVSADWNANPPGTVGYRSGAVQTGMHDVSPGSYVAYFAYQNTDTAGSQSFGVSSPTGQQATLGGVELQGVSEVAVFDSLAPGANGIGVFDDTVSWFHTCTGHNRLLTVPVALGSGPDTGKTLSVQYGGIEMSSAGLVHTNNQNSGYIELFYLVNPPSGTDMVTVLASSSADLIAGSVSFVGVDQTTPFTGFTTSFGESTSPSLAILSKAGDIVVAAVANGGDIASSNQTTRWLHNFSSGTGASNASQATAPGAAGYVTTTYSVTSDWWGMVGFNVLANGTAPPTPPDPPVATVAWLTA